FGGGRRQEQRQLLGRPGAGPLFQVPLRPEVRRLLRRLQEGRQRRGRELQRQQRGPQGSRRHLLHLQDHPLSHENSMKKLVTALLGAGLLSAQTAVVHAAVSADEARKLGTTLTAVGAEKAGNTDGSIPEYTGGLVTP